jgi:hypothetical protein
MMLANSSDYGSGCANPFRWSIPSSGANGGVLPRILPPLLPNIAIKDGSFRCERVAIICTRVSNLPRTQRRSMLSRTF